MAYRLSVNAEADFEGIADYIAERNAPAATRLVRRFVQQWELLVTQPLSGQSCDDLVPGGRRLVMGNYLACYRVQGGDVLILRILHGNRDITADDLSD